MTALDRSIIKAYHRPSSRSGTAVAEPPVAAPPSTRLRAAAGPAVPLSQALAELAATSATPSASGKGAGGAEPTTAPVSPTIAALLDHAIHATTVTEATAVEVAPSIAVLANQAFQATAITTLADQPFQTTASTANTPFPAEIGEDTSVPTAAVAATAAPSTYSARSAVASTPSVADTVATAQEPDETPWRPLLQVDRVVWPSIHDRLQTTAAAALEQMTEGLLSICTSGSKVLGLASCASGEGVTTLLLAAARKLLSQGRKVVLVDANWGNPQLAQSLGLLPQIGWEETLCGGLPLEEVVIETLADGMAVLPVREPSASAITQEQIAASFDILAREFNVVLVDLGPLAEDEDEGTSSPEGIPLRDVAAQMDAVILVQNVRVTTPNQLAEVQQRLAASNLRCAGTIQNFVAG